MEEIERGGGDRLYEPTQRKSSRKKRKPNGVLELTQVSANKIKSRFPAGCQREKEEITKDQAKR